MIGWGVMIFKFQLVNGGITWDLHHIYPYRLIRLCRTCGGGTATHSSSGTVGPTTFIKHKKKKQEGTVVGSRTPSLNRVLSWLVKCATVVVVVVVVNGNGNGRALCIVAFMSAETRIHRSYCFLPLSPSIYLLVVAVANPTATWNEYQHGGVQYSLPPIHPPARTCLLLFIIINSILIMFLI